MANTTKWDRKASHQLFSSLTCAFWGAELLLCLVVFLSKISNSYMNPEGIFVMFVSLSFLGIGSAIGQMFTDTQS